MNRLDELTDINFRLICQSKSGIPWLHFVDSNGDQLTGQIREQIAKYMADNGLVTIDGELCYLDLKSENICESGWIGYLKSKTELPNNIDLSFDETTLQNLERLKNGQNITLTKDSHKESADLIRNLHNLGILHKPTRFGYACDLKNRKYLTKLIELQSWEKFLDLSENENNKSDFINDFSGANIGQVNQSSEKMDLKSPVTQKIVHKTAKEPKKKSWIEILAWIIGILAGLVAIYEFIS